jgi:hypothetical protein
MAGLCTLTTVSRRSTNSCHLELLVDLYSGAGPDFCAGTFRLATIPPLVGYPSATL